MDRVIGQGRQRASIGSGAGARRATALGLALATTGTTLAAAGNREVDRDHEAWSALLSRHVSGSLVDCAALKRGRSELDAYLRSLESVERAELEAWPRSDQLAFWINAYVEFLDHDWSLDER